MSLLQLTERCDALLLVFGSIRPGEVVLIVLIVRIQTLSCANVSVCAWKQDKETM